MNCEELIRKRIADKKRHEEGADSDAKEYATFLAKVKQQIPVTQIWQNTIGDKINTLQKVAELEHKRIYQRYRLNENEPINKRGLKP